MIGKWGLDGASGQQATRQKWTIESELSKDSSENNEDNVDKATEKSIKLTDQSVLMVSFVSLQLKCENYVI